MSDEPSLLLASHHRAHREQQLQKKHHHHRPHRRQEAGSNSGTVVTEVVTTVSVLQQVHVDTDGNILTVETLLSDSTGGLIPFPLTSIGISSDGAAATSSTVEEFSPVPPFIYTPAPTAVATGTSIPAAASSAPSQSLLAGPDSISAVSIPSTTPSFASFIVSSNSTSLISGSSSIAQTFSNSSRTSTSLSSSASTLSYSKQSSTTLLDDYSLTSTSLLTSSTSLAEGTSSGVIGILGGGTTSSGPSATTSATSGNDSGDDTPATPTPVIVGGVVGSIAGAAVIIIALLFIWRWQKRKGTMLVLGNGATGEGSTAREISSSQPPGGNTAMTEQRSFPFAVPASLAALTGVRNKRESSKTDRTISSTAGSERGFYRVSGRKLPSVLQTGGDGYGGGVPDENTLSGSSFYRDSHGFYGGPGGPASPSIPPDMQRESAGGIPIMRPSPARTPVTEQPPWPSTPPNLPPPRPDMLGRSHPSQDGSHTSRFTEEV